MDSSARPIRLATRQSPLALWQARWVERALIGLGHRVELVLLTTQGDVDQRPITGQSSVGLFTKGIQRCVLDGQADVAIHSLKDLPTALTPGLTLVATPPRAPVADCLICGNPKLVWDSLPPGSVVGTGSRRREAQLRHMRSDLKIKAIRGNVETRLAKLHQGEFDAIILAQAGLMRLEMQQHISQIFPVDQMLPAPGQGALGIEVRSDDAPCAAILATLNDPPTMAAITAERTLMSTLQGGCLAPIGAYGRCADGQLHLDACVVSIDGARRLSASGSGMIDDASAIGKRVAQDLLDQGAAPIIAEVRS